MKLAQLKLVTQFPGKDLTLDTISGNISTFPVVAELYQNPYHPENHPVSHSNLSSLTDQSWQAVWSDSGYELYAINGSTGQGDMADTTDGQAIEQSLVEKYKLLIEHLVDLD